jgi:hypothetical protein
MKTTNYHNTFITVADDCPVAAAEIPKARGGEKTVAMLQYEMIKDNPYRYTSDDVIFQVHASRKGIKEKDLKKERDLFFSKGQPCLRSSPLTKRYGWGVHCNEKGEIALYEVESPEYRRYLNSKAVKVVKAMRSKKAD